MVVFVDFFRGTFCVNIDCKFTIPLEFRVVTLLVVVRFTFGILLGPLLTWIRVHGSDLTFCVQL